MKAADRRPVARPTFSFLPQLAIQLLRSPPSTWIPRLRSWLRWKRSIWAPRTKAWSHSQRQFLPFFTPAAILLIVLVLYPIAATLVQSFETPSGAGLQNYADILGSTDTINLACLGGGQPCGALINNLIWIVIHLPLTLFGGLFLAILLQDVRGGSIFKSLIFLGLVTPLIVIGVILRFVLEAPIGIVPAFFGLVGIPQLDVSWLVTPSILLLALVLATVRACTGCSIVVSSAVLTTIPKDYFEAARVDGASEWRIFRTITWPLLRPVTLVVITMTILWELKLFDIIIGATNAYGGAGAAADVLALQMYRFFLNGDWSHASVVATLLTVLTLVVAVFLFRSFLNLPRLRRGRLFARRKPKEEPESDTAEAAA